ncbi:hypothetical protein F5Y19DRAFT_449783 [Xylariaceae sp. FL1651]|nr:hypothetical protein F5Y19DRAFT_449783 [Xylariaceae sp. FL1651]
MLMHLMHSIEAVVAALVVKKSELRNLLNPIEHDFIRTKLDGTLEWVSSHPITAQWLAASAPPTSIITLMPQLLLISGPKGSGKSVLAASIADHVRNTGRPCAFFSFYHGIERQRKRNAMFSTILWQMLNFDELSSETLDQVCKVLHNSNSALLSPVPQAIERVAATLKNPFYIVIDGIDESDDDWSGIDGPLKTFEGWMGQFTQLRVLLAGRQSILHFIFAKYPNRSIELSEDITREDIFKLISHKLRESRNLNAMSEQLKAHIQQTLQEKSTGMFLWVELVFKELQHCHSPRAVRDCLRDLPQDLEAEYARLFSKLMNRLPGQVGRPTSSIRAARTLLALIMGATEPLTVHALRHAYAASCGKDHMWEDDLITEDAVLDYIGDFITYRRSGNQYVSLCHFSLEELLLLPHEKWTGVLKDIEFFRLEYLECHQLMAHACLNYVANFDFGYPLTEDSYHKLTGKVFLNYATKNGLSHLFLWRSTDTKVTKAQTDLLKASIAGPNFGGLVEFMAITSIERVDFIEGYISCLFGNDLDEFLSIIAQRIAAENAYRVDTFGSDDPRTQSWSQIQTVFSKSLFLPSSPKPEHFPNGKFTTLTPSLAKSDTAQSSDEHTEVSLQGLFWLSSLRRPARAALQAPATNSGTDIRTVEAFNTAVQSNIQGMISTRMLRQALEIWVDPKATFNKVVQSFVAGIPIPLHIAYAHAMVHSKELSITLLDLARQRTEGQRTLYRAWALMDYYSCDTDNSQRERYRSEAHSVILGLEDNPITRSMMYANVRHRVSLLHSLDRDKDIPRLIDDLLNRTAKPHSRMGSRRRQHFVYSLVYKSDRWREFEINWLSYIARTLFDFCLFVDAERVYGYVCACAKTHYGIHASKTLHLFLHHIESLINIRDLVKAEQLSSEILMVYSSKEPLRYDFHSAEFFTVLATFKQGKYNQGPDVLHKLLQDVKSGKHESWSVLDSDDYYCYCCCCCCFYCHR